MFSHPLPDPETAAVQPRGSSAQGGRRRTLGRLSPSRL